MVIESLKAVQTAIREAMKDKDMSDASRVKLQESNAALQKLLDQAREAAKEAKEGYQAKKEEEGEEAGMKGEEEEEAEGVEPGHTMTVTHKKTVKHDGPKDEEEDGSDGDGKDGDEKDEMDKDAEESHRGYIKMLLKEAGIPKSLWSLDKLARMTLKEAKAEIGEKKALIEEVRKSQDVEFVPAGDAQPLHESTGSEGTLNGLFSGCAQ